MGDLRPACVADKEVAKKHAKRRNPGLKARWHATHASSAEGVAAVISARIAEKCNRASGRELTDAEEKSQGSLTGAAERGGLNASKKFKAFQPLKRARPDLGYHRYSLGAN